MRTIPILLLLLAAGPLAAVDEGMLQTEPGVEIYWTALGSGSSTVIVPGGFLLEDDFAGLSSRFRLIFYDMRNRGRSSAVHDPELLTIEGDVNDLEALRRHFDVDTFSTIGYSYLGKMAILYGLRYPGRLHRVVQIGPVPMRSGAPIPPTLDNTSEEVFDLEALAEIRALREEGIHLRDPRAYCEREWTVTRDTLVGDPAFASRLSSPCHMPNEWPTRLATHLEHHFSSAIEADVSPLDVARAHDTGLDGSRDTRPERLLRRRKGVGSIAPECEAAQRGRGRASSVDRVVLGD